MRDIDWPKPMLKSKITDMIDRVLKSWCDENGTTRPTNHEGDFPDPNSVEGFCRKLFTGFAP
jgi:hypothetical protein